jgi:hypothetical protein
MLLALLTALAWFGIKYVPLGLLIGAFFLHGAGWYSRGVFLALGAVAGVFYVWFHYAIFGELTPYNFNIVYQGASTEAVLQHHLAFEERIYRLWGLFIDRRFGIGHWAPLLLLVLPALPLLLRSTRLGGLVLALLLTQLLIATFLAITMMGWWFPGRTLVAVLPLTPLVLTLLLSKLAPPWRLAVAALAVWSAATTVALTSAARNSEITLAVDPFDMRSPVFQTAASLFPDYRAWTSETVLLTTAWLAAFAIAMIACGRLAGLSLPRAPRLVFPRLRLSVAHKTAD